MKSVRDDTKQHIIKCPKMTLQLSPVGKQRKEEAVYAGIAKQENF